MARIAIVAFGSLIDEPGRSSAAPPRARSGYRGSPFEGTDREDSETPLAGELSDPV